MEKFSKLYWDRPQSPQEAVNYWTEYVIRHGKNVLRSPAVDLEWWQFDLLDVYCFLFVSSILALISFIFIIVYAFRFIVRQFTAVETLKSNKKLN